MSWDCDLVFASEPFLCSCCKGRVFLFECISTVVDMNLSLVQSVRHSCLKFSFLLLLKGKKGDFFVGSIYWVFNTMPILGTKIIYCTKALKKPPGCESFSALQKVMVKQHCDFQTVPEILP